MDSFVSNLSQSMEYVRKVTGNHSLPKQRINAYNSRIIIRQGYSVIGEDQINNRFDLARYKWTLS